MSNEKNIETRRSFLKKGGIITAGLLMTGLAGVNSIAKGSAEPALSDGSVAAATPLTLPLNYAKLDVEVVRKRGYEGYQKGGCCYGAAYALLTTLREVAPNAGWDGIPAEMFSYGGGGGLSWGTLCGALNSSLAVLNLASAKYSDLGNELVGWYTKFPFPSKNFESYCAIKNQVTTIAESPLCHVSVSRWSAAAGKDGRINDAGKKDRCAKVTGDTAAKAAELLNLMLEGKFVASYKPADDFAHCLTCHTGKTSMRDDEQGKMNCLMCHTEL